MKVSVITPVYNGERYFDRAPPSILSQTTTDFEWVIVDDGSTDRTPDLLAALAARTA
jgi:glycosyltransferase involved in cell wall biosynthesis